MRSCVLALVTVAACRHGPGVTVEGPADEHEPHRPPRHIDDDGDDDGERDGPPPRPPRQLPRPELLEPEPAIAVATIAPHAHGDRPWPLTELPSTQPHLDVAMAHDACAPAGLARAVHADVHAYFVAWCRIRAGDASAVDALAPLAQSARADVMRAAKLDVIDLVANADDARSALLHLMRLGLATVEYEQLLAATYVALGAAADAVIVADAVLSIDPKPAPHVACERLLAWSELDARFFVQLPPVETIRDDRCAPRAAAVGCALRAAQRLVRGDLGSRLVAMRECYRELPDDPDRDGKLELMLVHACWGASDAARWIELARHAEVAIGLPGAEEYALVALDNAVLASDCDAATLDDVRAAGARIAALHAHRQGFDARVAGLAGMTKASCVALHP